MQTYLSQDLKEVIAVPCSMPMNARVEKESER